MNDLILLAVFDVMAGAYVGTPQGCPTRGVGERAFADEVNRPDSQFGRHPDDYELHEVGSFNPMSGVLLPVQPRPIVYGRARQFLKEV